MNNNNNNKSKKSNNASPVPPFSVAAAATNATTSSDQQQQQQIQRADAVVLEDATDLIGTCPQMCPSEEMTRREAEQDIQLLETLHPSLHPPDWTLVKTTVKRFRRSAADYKLNVPEWVRPPHVLEQTCAYLEEWIMDKDRQGPDARYIAAPQATTDRPTPLDVYLFCWDRTRMIRKDFILQNYVGGDAGKCNASAIRCHERIARWHVLCEHQLSHLNDFVTMQSQQNIAELGQALKTLNLFYDTPIKKGNNETTTTSLIHGCHHTTFQGEMPKNYHSGQDLSNDESYIQYRMLGNPNAPNDGTSEAEMRGLYILLTIDNDGGMEVLKYAAHLSRTKPDIYASAEVQLALTIFQTKQELMYAQFFRILRDPKTPYLFACLMFKHVEEMRRIAIRIMSSTYGYKAKTKEGQLMIRHDSYALKDLMELLCCEDLAETKALCEFYNITVKDDYDDINSSSISWKSSRFRIPRDPEKGFPLKNPPKQMIRTIEIKARNKTRLAICRGEVSHISDVLPTPSSAPSLPRTTTTTTMMATTGTRTSTMPLGPTTATHNYNQFANKEAILQQQQQPQVQQQQELLLKQQLLRQEEEEKKKKALLMKKKQDQLEAKKQLSLEKKKRAALKQKEEERQRQQQEEEEEKEQQKQELLRLQQQQREMEERKLERERLEQEAAHIEKERLERERLEKERLERERLEKERLERIEKERLLEQERLLLEKERLKKERERLEREARRLEQERMERERKQREEEEEEKRRILTIKKVLFWKRLRCKLNKTIQQKRSQQSLQMISSCYAPTSSILEHVVTNFKNETRDHQETEEIIISKTTPSTTTTTDNKQHELELPDFLEALIEQKDSCFSLETLLDTIVSKTEISAKIVSAKINSNSTKTTTKTVLMKVTTHIPIFQGGQSELVHQLMHQWIHSRLRYNKVHTSSTSQQQRKLRLVVTNGDNDCHSPKSTDVALIIIPPVIKGSQGTRDTLQHLLPNDNAHNSADAQDSSVLRVVWNMDDRSDPTYTDYIESEVIPMINPHQIVSSKRNDEDDDDFDQGLSYVLKDAMMLALKTATRINIVSILQLIFTAMDQVLLHHHSKNGNDPEQILRQARQALSKIQYETLPNLQRDLLLHYSSWPAQEFLETTSSSSSLRSSGILPRKMVPHYFAPEQHLPAHWAQSLISPQAEKTIETLSTELSSTSGSSYHDVVASLLFSDNDKHDDNARLFVQSLLRNRQYAQCLAFSIQHYCEQMPSDNDAFVYLPEGISLPIISDNNDKEGIIAEVSNDTETSNSNKTSTASLPPQQSQQLSLIAVAPQDKGTTTVETNEVFAMSKSGTTPRSSSSYNNNNNNDITPSAAIIQTPPSYIHKNKRQHHHSDDNEKIVDISSGYKRRRRTAEELKSMAFTRKLQAMLEGDYMEDMKIGTTGSKLSDLLRHAPPPTIPPLVMDHYAENEEEV
mmetsp:Transcript_16844/g.24925  ORF Transcript_16844/g.24925 Transcript_16844/m.24925 type:complete len:1444 (+) Transcript_16844:2-4333(+)